MPRKIFALAASLAGLLAVSLPAGAAPLRILALGDSYTAGSAIDPSQAWPAELVKRLRADKLDVGDATVIAREGWTTDELLAGIDEAGPRGPYDIVTVMIGVNDQFRGGSAEAFRPKLLKVVDRAIALAGNRSSNVIIITIPDYSVTPFGLNHDPAKTRDEIHKFNGVIVEVRRLYRLRFADVTPVSRTAASDPTLIAGDGLHPSPKMHGYWADRIYGAALRVLAGPPAPLAPRKPKASTAVKAPPAPHK